MNPNRLNNLKFEMANGVATITLYRPDKRNALESGASPGIVRVPRQGLG